MVLSQEIDRSDRYKRPELFVRGTNQMQHFPSHWRASIRNFLTEVLCWCTCVSALSHCIQSWQKLSTKNKTRVGRDNSLRFHEYSEHAEDDGGPMKDSTVISIMETRCDEKWHPTSLSAMANMRIELMPIFENSFSSNRVRRPQFDSHVPRRNSPVTSGFAFRQFWPS